MRSLQKMLLIFLFVLFSVPTFANVSQLLHNADDPSIGNPKAPITIVEFFDYQCGHCASMPQVLQTIVKTHPNVRVVFKEFPLRGDISTYAARAALAAKKQGKYFALYQAMLTSHYNLSPQYIQQLAKAVGLNIAKFKADMQDPTIAEQLHMNSQLGAMLRLRGTPAFYIGRSDAKKCSTIKICVRFNECARNTKCNKCGEIKIF